MAGVVPRSKPHGPEALVTICNVRHGRRGSGNHLPDRGQRLGYGAVYLPRLPRRPAQGRARQPGVRGPPVPRGHTRRRVWHDARVLRDRGGDDQRAQRRTRGGRVQLPGLVPAGHQEPGGRAVHTGRHEDEGCGVSATVACRCVGSGAL